MIPMIFKSDALNQRLWDDGFVTVPFLDQNSVASLKSACEPYVPKKLNHFFATTHSPNLELRQVVNEIIKQALAETSNQLFDQVHLLGAAYISKPANGKGILELHQDWNIVDENLHRSYNLWIPLVDTDENNGAVHILPKSHKREKTIRGPGIPHMFDGMTERIYPHLTMLRMKAGEALVYDHALWHSSPPNNSVRQRPAIVVGMVEKTSQLKAYFKEEDSIAEYELNADYFFKETDITKPTTLKKLRTFEFANPKLTEQKLNTQYFNQPRPWWKKLFLR